MPDKIELIMDLRSADLARALYRAVEPDNRTAPVGVAITTHQEGTRLITVINSALKLQTLLATFNDLVETLTTVINVLEGLSKNTENVSRSNLHGFTGKNTVDP